MRAGLRRPVAVALGLLLAEVALGGVMSLSGKSAALAAAHVALAALSFAATLAVAVRVRGDGRPGRSLRDYLILTKPRIMVLLLLTALRDGCGGSRAPDGWTFLVTMVGLALACGGAVR